MMMSENQAMPTIPFGKYTLSRLVAGSNALNGGSHLSTFLNRQMRRYFTDDKVIEHLKDCYDHGINAWQSVPGNLRWYQTLKDENIPMQFVSLGQNTPEDPEMMDHLVKAGAIAIAHHGEVTDIAFKSGQMGPVHEYCKRVRETGVMVGVSTHMPEVIDQILSEDWDVDFFMCCVYERHRSREQLMKLLGDVPIPVPEVYLENDPPRMYKMIRSTDKPCLAFKILAAGRLCEKQETVEQAFQDALSNIKANDGIIIGMYPEYENQVELNSNYVKKYSHLSQPYSRG